jgi:hypothetical protein
MRSMPELPAVSNEPQACYIEKWGPGGCLMPHAVLLMPHRRSSRACHEARRIVLGYSMIVPPAACVFTGRRSYQKQ